VLPAVGLARKRDPQQAPEEGGGRNSQADRAQHWTDACRGGLGLRIFVETGLQSMQTDSIGSLTCGNQRHACNRVSLVKDSAYHLFWDVHAIILVKVETLIFQPLDILLTSPVTAGSASRRRRGRMTLTLSS